jgi:hypothetical protein
MRQQFSSSRLDCKGQALGSVLIILAAVHHLGVHAAHADNPKNRQAAMPTPIAKARA